MEDGGRLIRVRTEDWDVLVNIYIPDYQISTAKGRLQQFIDSQKESNDLYEVHDLDNYRHGNIYGARYRALSQWQSSSCRKDSYEYLLTKDGSFYWWISMNACVFSDDATMWEIFEGILLY